MSKPPSMTYHLDMTLPPGWNLVDKVALRSSLQDAERLAVGAAREAIELLVDADSIDVDIAATLYLEATDMTGQPMGAVAAGMVASSISAADLPGPDHPAFKLQEVDGVQLLEGLPISYLVFSYPVLSSDRQVAELLTFSSPNLSLAPLLENAFRAFASNATLTANPSS